MVSPTTLLVGQKALLEEALAGSFKGLKCDTLEVGTPYVDALKHYDRIIDLELDTHPERLKLYLMLEGTLVLGRAVFRSLTEMVAGADWPAQCQLFGLNAMPAFLGREVLEVSRYTTGADASLQALADELSVKLEWVNDRVGMATPRVLAMIINEAYWMHTEGAATPDAIDSAMLKGVNYPKGPFEWAEQIGHVHLVKLLEALQADGQPARYPIAPTLKQAALKSQIKLNESK